MAAAGALMTGHRPFPLLDPGRFLPRGRPALAANWGVRTNELVCRLLLAAAEMGRGAAEEAGGTAGHLNQLL